MHSRKQTIGRKMLRVFEIALFFAISVLGYGLMLKVSSTNAKSKSRDRDAVCLQHSLELNGLHRELKLISGPRFFPAETITGLPRGNTASDYAFAAIHPVPRFARHLLSGQNHASLYADNNSRLPRPFNLLEQNPVLLN